MAKEQLGRRAGVHLHRGVLLARTEGQPLAVVTEGSTSLKRTALHAGTKTHNEDRHVVPCIHILRRRSQMRVSQWLGGERAVYKGRHTTSSGETELLSMAVMALPCVAVKDQTASKGLNFTSFEIYLKRTMALQGLQEK